MSGTFTSDEFEDRIRKIRMSMEADSIDCLLVYGAPNYMDGNFRYISGTDSNFGSSIVVIPLEVDPLIITDSVLHGQSAVNLFGTSWIKDIRTSDFASSLFDLSPSIPDHVVSYLKDRHLEKARLGIASKYSFPAYILERVKSQLPGITTTFFDSALSRIKSIKSEQEIEVCRKNARIADLAMETAIGMVKHGVSELEISAKAVSALVENGASNVALSHPVSCISGEKAGNRVLPTERKLQTGDLVSIGVGSNLDGYQTYIHRSTTVGQPNPEQRKLLETVLNIQTAVIGSLQTGVVVNDIIQVQMGMLRDSGYVKTAHPFVGQGLGTDLVNLPMIVSGYPGQDEQLEPGMVLIVGPTVTADGIGTVSFQDALLINESTHEDLTRCAKRTWQ